MEKEGNRVFPVVLAKSLDGKIIRWHQKPHTNLSPYDRE